MSGLLAPPGDADGAGRRAAPPGRRPRAARAPGGRGPADGAGGLRRRAQRRAAHRALHGERDGRPRVEPAALLAVLRPRSAGPTSASRPSCWRAGACARARTAPSRSRRSVSIVIAARNEEASIGAKLDNLAALDYPADRFEVLIASDGSDDATNRHRRRARRPARAPAGPAARGQGRGAERRGRAGARRDPRLLRRQQHVRARRDPPAGRALRRPARSAASRATSATPPDEDGGERRGGGGGRRAQLLVAGPRAEGGREPRRPRHLGHGRDLRRAALAVPRGAGRGDRRLRDVHRRHRPGAAARLRAGRGGLRGRRGDRRGRVLAQGAGHDPRAERRAGAPRAARTRVATASTRCSSSRTRCCAA